MSGKALLRALAAAGLSPHADDAGVTVALCPVCENDGASLRVTLTPTAARCLLGCSVAHVLEELSRCAEQITEPGPRAALDVLVSRVKGEADRNKLLRLSSEGTPWPTMPAAAYYGPLGEAARAIEPLSEADPAAVLVQLAVAFGSAVGRGARLVLGNVRQWANLFVVIVGKSSKARKGTSWENVAEVLAGVDEAWAKGRIKSGLSSGEGVIHAVRDALVVQEPLREGGKRTGRILDYQDVEQDPGEPDKRLLVVESEFARTLKVGGRKESVLSPVLRDAWDSGQLSVLTKSPYKATGAHVSIVGHVTRDELRRELSACDSFNGFANRFLWVCARRSKELPFGERRIGEAAAKLTARLAAAIQAARDRGDCALDMDAGCRSRWSCIYSSLSADRPGLVGSVLNRGEAQVLRLALVYALADGEGTIRLPHLEAALAVWSYCEKSARLIFGDALGDPIADEILRVLRESPDGMTRDELRNHFDRHVPAARLTQALTLLAENGLASGQKESPPGSRGRPAERWFATPTESADGAEIEPPTPNNRANGANRATAPNPEPGTSLPNHARAAAASSPISTVPPDWADDAGSDDDDGETVPIVNVVP